MHTQMCTPSFIQIIKFSGNMCPMHTHTQPHACALRHTNTYPTTYSLSVHPLHNTVSHNFAKARARACTPLTCLLYANASGGRPFRCVPN